MKLKLLLFILLLPFVSFGASTNKVDNLWVPSSARFSFGLPGVGKVLTSDAVGFSSWSLPSAGFDPSTNWTSGGYVTFNSGFRSIASSSNLFYYLQTTNINFGAVSGSPNGKMYWDAANGYIGMDYLTVNNPLIGTGQIYLGNGAAGGVQFNSTLAGILGINYAVGQELQVQSGAAFRMIINDTGTEIRGNLNVTNNVIFGTGSANTMTINGVAIAMPNGLNFGSGNLVLPAASSGTSTNGYANAYFTGSIIATNAGAITQIDELMFVGLGIISNRTTGATLQIR